MPTKKADDDTAQAQPSVASALPANWPDDITFLTDQTYSAAVTAEMRAGLSRRTLDDPRESSTVGTYAKVTADMLTPSAATVEIRTIGEDAAAAPPPHPARGQRGLFAARAAAPDAFLCLYLGRVHTNSLSDTDPHSDYDLSLDHELGLSVDAARAGNEARFANDYRGIAPRPNVEFRDCFVRVPSRRADGVKWERRVGLFVLSAGKVGGKRARGVQAGEEILVSYGKGFWEGRKTMATFRKDVEMLKIANAALNA